MLVCYDCLGAVGFGEFVCLVFVLGDCFALGFVDCAYLLMVLRVWFVCLLLVGLLAIYLVVIAFLFDFGLLLWFVIAYWF